MDYTTLTLSQLMAYRSDRVRRQAIAIFKMLPEENGKLYAKDAAGRTNDQDRTMRALTEADHSPEYNKAEEDEWARHNASMREEEEKKPTLADVHEYVTPEKCGYRNSPLHSPCSYCGSK